METTTITENNKLISEFIGHEFITKEAFLARYPKDFLDASDNYKCFHNSWDWLMPVVERIEGKRGAISVYIGKRITQIESRANLFPTITAQGSTKIEATYKAVVEFINWYNSQQPTP